MGFPVILLLYSVPNQGTESRDWYVCGTVHRCVLTVATPMVREATLTTFMKRQIAENCVHDEGRDFDLYLAHCERNLA
jgi:hypothetical protein